MDSDLSLADLRAVVTVAAHGHFGRAAAALRLAQPTLSGRVLRVERVFGAALFERAARRFVITAEGERLLPLMRETLAAAERLHAQASGGDAARPRPLRLGIIPTLGPYLLPHLLLPLRRERPSLELSISERPTAALTSALLDGVLDAALLSLPLRSDSLEKIPLFDEPFKLIAPRGSPIISAAPLVPSRLCASDMILLEDGHCLRDQALAACGRRGGAAPRLVTTSLETLKYLVASGAGYSLLPALACELRRGLGELVQLRDFDERPPSRRIALCFRRTLTGREALLDLAEFIRRRAPADVAQVAHVAPVRPPQGMNRATHPPGAITVNCSIPSR